MQYTPKSEEALAKESLLPEGIYSVEVAEATQRQSKKGNEMIALKLNVFDSEAAIHSIFDYIVMGSNFGERKLRHAANAFGLIDVYDAGSLTAEHFLYQSGQAEIKQQNGTTDYPMPKNVVGDYISREEGTTVNSVKKKETKTSEEFISDSVPF